MVIIHVHGLGCQGTHPCPRPNSHATDPLWSKAWEVDLQEVYTDREQIATENLLKIVVWLYCIMLSKQVPCNVPIHFPPQA